MFDALAGVKSIYLDTAKRDWFSGAPWDPIQQVFKQVRNLVGGWAKLFFERYNLL